LSNAVTLRRDKSVYFSRVAILVLLYSSTVALNSFYIIALDRGIGLFGGLFHATSTTHTFQIFIFIISLTILQLTGFYSRRVWIPEYSSLNKLFRYDLLYYKSKILNKMGQQYKIIEYPLIILFIITGAVFLISSSDLVSIFLSIELQSYGLYLLSTLYRNSELATSGGLTYFLLGGLSSCFILLGTTLLYANSGTTNLDGIYVLTSISDLSYTSTGVNDVDMVAASRDLNNEDLDWYKSDYINISFLILSVGFLFKVSAAPFHFWSPDVYDAIPTIVTTFVAIIAKISIFIFFLELVHYSSNSLFNNEFSWTTSLIVSSLLSLIIGTVLGLSQVRIKRLFAYSTISHLGFILLALTINSIESIQAFIFYLMQYSISNLNGFIILISIGFSLFYYSNDTKEYKELAEKDNSPIQLVSQLKGYFYINPALALCLTITIFSFVGIPPLIGFFAKQMVLSAALDSGFVFMALVAILTSVISAVYYLNIIKQIFFDQPDYKINEDIKNLSLHANIEKVNYFDAESENLMIRDIRDSIPKDTYLTLVSLSKVNNIREISAAESEKLTFKVDSIRLSSPLTLTISCLSLIIVIFMFIPDEWLSMANILALIIFNT
jgi:NADH-ubiquinone oxidoreductase chain 2